MHAAQRLLDYCPAAELAKSPQRTDFVGDSSQSFDHAGRIR